MSNYCRVYWGSHGCSLERGHAEDWHQCGLESPPQRCEDCDTERADAEGSCPNCGSDAVYESDSLCSRIDWSPEEGIWVWRFADVDESWIEGDLFPAFTFGEDLPAALTPPVERVEAVRQQWQDEGRMAVWEDGGWVKRVKG